MADAAPPPLPKRNTLTLVLLALAVLLIIYFVYRFSTRPAMPPTLEPTPAVAEVTATAIPTAPLAPTPTPGIAPRGVPTAGAHSDSSLRALARS